MRESNVVTPLRRLRKEAGLTQPGLAAASGLDIRKIQRIENGEILAENLRLKSAVKIAAALNVRPEDLMDNTD